MMPIISLVQNETNQRPRKQFKTGSKSCSAALRVLGYNVADYLETTEGGFQIKSSDWFKITISHWLI